MPMIRLTLFTLLRRGALCLGLAICLQTQPAVPVHAQDTLRIAAVVNEDIITELDVYMRLRMALMSAKLDDTEETRQRLIPQVIRNLIDDHLKLQEAKRANIKVNPADVEKRINALAERNNLTREQLEDYLKG